MNKVARTLEVAKMKSAFIAESSVFDFFETYADVDLKILNLKWDFLNVEENANYQLVHHNAGEHVVDKKPDASSEVTVEGLDNVLPHLTSSDPDSPLRELLPKQALVQLHTQKLFQLELNDLLEHLRCLRTKNKLVIILVAGGRFAGVVFDKKEPVVHKTFHRYTVRAKQGGSQGVRDAQQIVNAPRSAGATLRRYNESALAGDIRNLMLEWKQHLDEADFIFLRCSTYHRKIFFGTDQLFDKFDSRIKTVPFPTYKPTFEEAKRVHKKLLSVFFCGSHDDFFKSTAERCTGKKRQCVPLKRSKTKLDEQKLRNDTSWADIEENSKSQSNGISEVKENSCTGNDEMVARDTDEGPVQLYKRLRQDVYTAVSSGCVEDLEKLLLDGKSDFDVGQLLDSRFGDGQQSFLHMAAAVGHNEVVKLLLKFGCNPTFKNRKGEVPFQVSKDKIVRRTFSEFRGSFPDKWDWNKAQVPQPLTEDEQKQREEKAAEKRRGARLLQKKKQKEKKAAEQENSRVEEEKRKYLELSDREKRALAAERRILEKCEESGKEKPILSRCFICAKDISGLVPFEYSDNRFCSMKCLKEHKQMGK